MRAVLHLFDFRAHAAMSSPTVEKYAWWLVMVLEFGRLENLCVMVVDALRPRSAASRRPSTAGYVQEGPRSICAACGAVGVPRRGIRQLIVEEMPPPTVEMVLLDRWSLRIRVCNNYGW